MVFVYAIFVVNAYVSIKYEVETIDNDAIINMVYQIFDTGVTINFIWFAINTIIFLGLYIKLRRKWKIIWLCKRLHNVKYWTWNRNPKGRNKLKLSGVERITDMIIEKKQEEVKNITYKDRRTFPPSFTIDYINYLKGYVVGFGSIMYGLFRIFE